jgi:hypothetical protein
MGMGYTSAFIARDSQPLLKIVSLGVQPFDIWLIAP